MNKKARRCQVAPCNNMNMQYNTDYLLVTQEEYNKYVFWGKENKRLEKGLSYYYIGDKRFYCNNNEITAKIAEECELTGKHLNNEIRKLKYELERLQEQQKLYTSKSFLQKIKNIILG